MSPRASDTGDLHQSLHPVSVPVVALQQGGHAVITAGGTGEPPADVLCHVEVAERDGVCITVRALPDFGRRPDTDAWK
jgi:hypothetical protein